MKAYIVKIEEEGNSVAVYTFKEKTIATEYFNQLKENALIGKTDSVELNGDATLLDSFYDDNSDMYVQLIELDI